MTYFTTSINMFFFMIFMVFLPALFLVTMTQAELRPLVFSTIMNMVQQRRLVFLTTVSWIESSRLDPAPSRLILMSISYIAGSTRLDDSNCCVWVNSTLFDMSYSL